jgi:hypothetical protein
MVSPKDTASVLSLLEGALIVGLAEVRSFGDGDWTALTVNDS